jgi:hypothetical protein
MHTKKNTNRFKAVTLLVCLCIMGISNLQAQTVWENSETPVMSYLQRMAQKGKVEFQDIIQPITRKQIEQALVALSNTTLTATEQKELNFYLQEYKSIQETDTAILKAIQKDANKRLRGLFLHQKDFTLNVDPLGSLARISTNGNSFTQMSHGLNFWGQAKQFAFQFYYKDYTENGNGFESFRMTSPEKSIIKLYNPTTTSQNYSEIRGNISYSFNKGSISLGKDHLSWGYGENGKIVLDNKVNSYPLIRLDYSPTKWMQFNYTHAWLNSNIVDSNALYTTGIGAGTGEQRIQFIPKYMATHSLVFTPTKGLNIAIGETVVYSDKTDVGFFIPVNFFKIYDNNRSNYNINAGSNGQFFVQASSRNQIKNTHLYGSMFIDEIRIATIFNKAKSRNQLGYTLGGSVTDILLPYLTLGTEYTRVNPFVYTNLVAAQNYTQYERGMGDWMGNNFDRYMLFAKYNPIPKLNLYARFQSIRKGGLGSIAEQYLAEPQPPFLFDMQIKRKDWFLQFKYEWINNFYLFGSFESVLYSFKKEKAHPALQSGQTIQLGLSFGIR